MEVLIYGPSGSRIFLFKVEMFERRTIDPSRVEWVGHRQYNVILFFSGVSSACLLSSLKNASHPL